MLGWAYQKSNPCHCHKEGARNEVFKKCCYYVLSQDNVVNSFLMGQSHFLMKIQVHWNRNTPSKKNFSPHCNEYLLLLHCSKTWDTRYTYYITLTFSCTYNIVRTLWCTIFSCPSFSIPQKTCFSRPYCSSTSS